MTREGVPAKARRLLLERRVMVERVDGRLAVATVLGDTGRHEVRHVDPDGWSCSCASRVPCSHIAAVRFVVDPEPLVDVAVAWGRS